jgi:hypothetical protein
VEIKSREVYAEAHIASDSACNRPDLVPAYWIKANSP